MTTLTLEAANTAETEAFGMRLSALLPPLRLIFVRGPLGAGKTTFVRGLLRGLGHEGVVKSPTFTLVEPYNFGEVSLYHFDLYRLTQPQELEFLGLRDYLAGDNICIVEWPERAGGILPAPDLDVMIQLNDKQGRLVQLQSHSRQGEAVLGGFR
ncbi:MAG: tRNA (adenosine(37)-N6)-threonylcarbamoyltransferase complex ATPase subunit type 1 TsaE [Gammaproteobacteria bacterium]|nr:tRNA (adenosine(37)-N6)-threonylcarbamoyltransferase complex ATPase subunit type 1 TsaE [Gammaproteobacteria bacterium]